MGRVDEGADRVEQFLDVVIEEQFLASQVLACHRPRGVWLSVLRPVIIHPVIGGVSRGGEAKASGLELRDTKVLIFGSPQAGTPVMQAAPLAALDLPLKVLVWADGNQSKLSYTAPAALAARYELSDELAARLSGIDALTNTLLDQ